MSWKRAIGTVAAQTGACGALLSLPDNVRDDVGVAPGVAAITGGLVQTADLTTELRLGVADWVLCLEVAEHIPRAHEEAFVQNLHAHNRCGVLLSWACCVSGHQHVNLRSNAHVIESFEQLGYRYDAARSEAMRRPQARLGAPSRLRKRARRSVRLDHRGLSVLGRTAQVCVWAL